MEKRKDVNLKRSTNIWLADTGNKAAVTQAWANVGTRRPISHRP